jgi:hypothetical protein
MFESDSIFLSDLSTRWDCPIRIVIEQLLKNSIDAYTFIDAEGTISFNPDEVFRAGVSGIYKLDKNTLLKVSFNEREVSIEDSLWMPRNEKEEEELYANDFNLKSLSVNSIYGNWRQCNFETTTDVTMIYVEKHIVESFETSIGLTPCDVQMADKIKPRMEGIPSKFPNELKVALEVYEEFWEERPQDQNPAREEDIRLFINEKMGGNVNQSALDRIRTVARPENERKGGAPSSERKTYKGKSKQNA